MTKTLMFCVSLLCVCLLASCSDSRQITNTKSMPGHAVSNMLNSVRHNKHEDVVTRKNLTKTRNGVYIYKDNTTTNTAGVVFKENKDVNVGPSDVTFKAEKFKTRY